ncbi:DUF971 domain-containing protein [Verrucomicrobia bacterium]|nr:DUF971 domain-containing protein [Verrucomicrobiota bacterium]
MQLVDLQPVGIDLALKWNDDAEHFVSLEALRRACPCASCAGETDVMGNVAKGPETAFTEASFQIKHLQPVGGYAVQIFWKDGHGTGLYSHEYLRAIGEKNDQGLKDTA